MYRLLAGRGDRPGISLSCFLIGLYVIAKVRETLANQNCVKDEVRGKPVSKLPPSVTLVACLFGQRHAQAALPPGKTGYPLNRKLSGPQGRSGRVRKISPTTGIQSLDRSDRSESLY